MSDDETTEASPPEGTDHERLDRLEGKVDRIADLIDKIVPGSHGEAEQRAEQRLDRPSTIEEQVQAELAKRDRDAAEKQRSEEHASLKETVAKLAEKPPAPPLRRATKLLGWGSE